VAGGGANAAILAQGRLGRLTVTGFQLAQSDFTLMYPEAPAESTAMA
jgi:hypothetical protein